MRKKTSRGKQSADESFAEDQRLKEIAFEAAEMGCWRWDLENGTVNFDAPMAKLFGLVEQETTISIEDAFAAVHPEDEPLLRQKIDGARGHTNFFQDELRLDVNEEEYRWLSVRGKFLCENSTQPDVVIGVCYNITTRKRAEEELVKSEEIKRAILNTAADAIITINSNGIIIDNNPAAENIFGYEKKELVGQNVSTLMPSPDREKHDEYIQRYLKTGKKHIIGSRRETLAKRKDGTTFPIELSISEVDHLGLFTGIISDVTARKTTEEEQRRVSEFNQKIIGTAQTIILILSPEGDITYFNPYFEEISGWKIEDARGKNWFSTFLPERDRKRISSLFGRSLTSSVRTRGNVNPILTKDGRERFVEWYDAVIYDNEGNIAGLLCTGVDVTRSRKLEQEVVKAAEEERSNTAQDLHDGLGSLLTGIDYRMKALGNRCSGIDPALEKEVVEISNLIRSAISQTRGIAKGLHPTGSGPEDLMDSLQTLTSTARMNSDSTIRFHCPEPVLITDPGSSNHLYRIAQEAFNNAIKHSQATYITISLVKKNGRAVLKVMDDGKGFDFSGPESGNLGLKTMHYRARTIGASLTINRRRKSGTEVICSMPI